MSWFSRWGKKPTAKPLEPEPPPACTVVPKPAPDPVGPMGPEPAPPVAEDVRHGEQTPAPAPAKIPLTWTLENFAPDGSFDQVFSDGVRVRCGAPESTDPARRLRMDIDAQMNFPDYNDPTVKKKKKRGGPGGAGGAGNVGVF